MSSHHGPLEVRLKRVTKSFDAHKAVDDLSLEVREGSVSNLFKEVSSQ